MLFRGNLRSIHLCLAAGFGLMNTGSAYSKDKGQSLDLTAGAGIRKDKLDWNIAGTTDGTSPNILSELQWTDLEIFQLKTAGKYSIGPAHIRGSFDFGWIVEGDNQDSDYACDNRDCEFSRSNSKSDEGSVLDLSLGAGYTIRVFDERTKSGKGSLDVIPMAGYSYHRQNLSITDGVQTIPADGPFPDLDSSYKARWRGPWAGLGVAFKYNALSVAWTGEYHWADYYGEGDWNLRTDFAHPKSFEQTADGSGFVNSLNIAYALTESWTLSGIFDWQNWTAEDGTDRTFFADGSAADTRFNEVNWESRAVSLAATYTFK